MVSGTISDTFSLTPRRHDSKLVSRLASAPAASRHPASSPAVPPLSPEQQFGASLEWIRDHHGGDDVPPIVRHCVQFLSKPECLETEGLFRR